MIEHLSDKDQKAFALIRGRLIHRGDNPTLKEINSVTGGKSPRSASIVVGRLIKAGLLRKVGTKIRLTLPAVSLHSQISTVNVPLVGSVSCGLLMLAEENIETYIPISTALAKGTSKYFLLRASGDSMNLAGIEDQSILLVRQQETASDGDRVVALVNDEATAKIFEKKNGIVILRPKSTNSSHKPIVLTDNCRIQGVIVATLPADLIN
jgi:repressor LexA